MIRILVFSDTHGQTDKMEKTIKNMIGVDYIVHLGDHTKDADYISLIYPEIKMINVSGNCDFCDPQPPEKTFEINGFKFLATHGHPYGVKTSLALLKKYAHDNFIDCVLFGHTHIPLCEKTEKTLFLNPGSGKYTAGVIEIENGNIKGCVIDV